MTSKRWSKEDIEFLKSNINSMTNAQLAQALGRTRSAIVKYKHRHRLTCEDPNWFNHTDEFKKRLSKANKGKPSPTKKRDGAISISNNEAWIKVNGKWVRAKKHFWEEKYGPIPKGHVLRAKKDNTSINPDDYVLMSKAEDIIDRTTPEILKKRHEKLKELAARDRLRVRYGLKPRTYRTIKAW